MITVETFRTISRIDDTEQSDEAIALALNSAQAYIVGITDVDAADAEDDDLVQARVLLATSYLRTGKIQAQASTAGASLSTRRPGAPELVDQAMRLIRPWRRITADWPE